MEFVKFQKNDYSSFHELANSYYREGEDENTEQDVIDSFVRMLFDMAIEKKIFACFLKDEGSYIGFALWAIDNEGFEFSEKPGLGTIMEIGISAPFRSSGYGKSLVSYIEGSLKENGISECYVSAYGPAKKFWTSCGYRENGERAENGLDIMVKTIA